MSPHTFLEQVGNHLESFSHPTIPTRKDWEIFRELIVYLYRDCDYRLQDVIDLMLREYNFAATKRMFTQRLGEWNVFKNIRSHDVIEYLQRTDYTTRQTRESSPSITLRGKTITKRRLLNHIKRSRVLPTVQSERIEDLSNDQLRLNTQFIKATTTHSSDSGTDTFVENPTDMPMKTKGNIEIVTDELEIQVGLSSEELTFFQIAMLQTDFHYQIDYGISTTIHNEQQERDPRTLTSLSLPKSLSGPQELKDLEFVLRNSDIIYARSPSRCDLSSDPFQLDTRQQSQAKDFYARHWLGIRLFSLNTSNESMRVGQGLLCKAARQIKPILEEGHPHFLTWYAFVVCYRRISQVQDLVLKLTLDTSRDLLSPSDPRLLIQACLAKSKFRDHICLVMLRHVISIFRQELQESHLKSLELLARLFNHIEACDNVNGDVVERTLQKWAQNSLTLAAVIKEDRKLH